MGQAEVLEFLETHPGKWYTSLEIRDHLGGTLGTVTGPLKRFREQGLVEYKVTRNPRTMYYYRYKE